jgi:ABC-type nitrate/sulfonate/bicarbonate transport system permease component
MVARTCSEQITARNAPSPVGVEVNHHPAAQEALMTLETIFPLIIGSGLGFSIGIFLGKMLERSEWNKLIDDGKLPRPEDLS